jgi:hypothetical protein
MDRRQISCRCRKSNPVRPAHSPVDVWAEIFRLLCMHLWCLEATKMKSPPGKFKLMSWCFFLSLKDNLCSCIKLRGHVSQQYINKASNSCLEPCFRRPYSCRRGITVGLVNLTTNCFLLYLSFVWSKSLVMLSAVTLFIWRRRGSQLVWPQPRKGLTPPDRLTWVTLKW